MTHSVQESNTPLHRAATLKSDRFSPQRIRGDPRRSRRRFRSGSDFDPRGTSGRVGDRGSRLIVIRSGLSLIYRGFTRFCNEALNYRGFTRFGDDANMGGASIDRVRCAR